MNKNILSVLTIIIVLFIVLEYAKLRSKYDWLYSNYATYYKLSPAGSTSSIGPTRIALTYERPWLANIITTRPITPNGAEFLIKLIKDLNITAEYLTNSVDNYQPPSVKNLNTFVSNEQLWKSDNNILYKIGAIPWNSDLVQRYKNTFTACTTQPCVGDLSLLILWLYGYEEYVRERFTASSTSVLSEWNFMFATNIPSPVPTNNGCDTSTITGNIMSMGLAGAGVGAAVSGGNPVGAFIGFFGGAIGSLLTKTKCL
jgi:hypothetical protein